MKKQVKLCTDATRNCKRCANLPKLGEQKMPKTDIGLIKDLNTFNAMFSNNAPTRADKQVKSRARRQVEMLDQMFSKSTGLLSGQHSNAGKQLQTGGCKC